VPMLSSLSVTHGFLSPHPAPTAIAEMFKADIGKTLLYGIIIPFPTIIVAGSLLSRTIKHIKATPLKEFYNPVILKDHEMSKMGVSIFTPLVPVLLIIISTLAFNFLSDDLIFKKVIVFLGNPVIAMLISVLVAIYTLELLSGKKMTEIMDSVTKSIASITMVLLIIAGGIPTFPIHSKRKNVVVSPGTPLLWDQGYTNLFPDLNFRPAAVLLSRIISKPNSNLICFDLGHKSVASEMQFPRVEFLNITNLLEIFLTQFLLIFVQRYLNIKKY